MPRTVLMHKRKKPKDDQQMHTDTDYNDVKVETPSMEEFEDMEENLDINVEHAGQTMNYEESPLEFGAPETKKRKHRQFTNLNLPCNVCGKRFPTKHRLETHQIIHTDKKPYQCDQCDRAFNQTANMSTHKKKMHYNQAETRKTEVSEENIEENEESDNVETVSEEEQEAVDLEKVESSEESGVETSSKLPALPNLDVLEHIATH